MQRGLGVALESAMRVHVRAGAYEPLDHVGSVGNAPGPVGRSMKQRAMAPRITEPGRRQTWELGDEHVEAPEVAPLHRGGRLDDNGIVGRNEEQTVGVVHQHTLVP